MSKKQEPHNGADHQDADADHADVAQFAAETLTGDIRDFLLDRVKAQGKPWAAMDEDEQSDAIHAAKDAAELLVQNACRIIAAQGKKAMIGTLVKVTIKDKLQAWLDFSKADEQRHSLVDAQGMTVAVVMADAEPFTGERGPAEPTPNQGDLIGNAEKLKGDAGKVTAIRK